MNGAFRIHDQANQVDQPFGALVQLILTVFLAWAVLLWTGPALAEDNSQSALANPLAINVKPSPSADQVGQPTKKVESLLPGQTIKMQGGGEMRIFSEDGRIEITAEEGSVILFEGMVKVESKPWLEDRPVLAREASDNVKLVPQFRLNLGQANVQVVTGQEMRLATPLITSAVRGTSFKMEVAQDGSSTLDVLEGKVLSMARDGQVSLLEAGKSARLTAAKFTEFLQGLSVEIPLGGDWRDVDPQVLNGAVSRAFGSSLDFLRDKTGEVTGELAETLAMLTPKESNSPQARNFPQKEMLVKP
ncbi:MAG: FecR domain-containing protein [Deltaproteobacteria bacterium]|jgi:hypothetical protein|nr:FecR domain-containing protein [Deltaproteobacteria bacterium]